MRYQEGQRIIVKRKNKKAMKLKVRGTQDDLIFCVDDEGRAYVVLESEVVKKG